jgi:hypothetical protein
MSSNRSARAHSGAQGGADASVGYARDGLSEHSHRAARAHLKTSFSGNRRSARGLLLEQEDMLAALRKELITAPDGERKKLLKNIRIKTKFISRLRIERDGEMS